MKNEIDEYGIRKMRWYNWRPPLLPTIFSIFFGYLYFSYEDVIRFLAEEGHETGNAAINELIFASCFGLNVWLLIRGVKVYKTKRGTKMSRAETRKWIAGIQQVTPGNADKPLG